MQTHSRSFNLPQTGSKSNEKYIKKLKIFYIIESGKRWKVAILGLCDVAYASI